MRGCRWAVLLSRVWTNDKSARHNASRALYPVPSCCFLPSSPMLLLLLIYPYCIPTYCRRYRTPELQLHFLAFPYSLVHHHVVTEHHNRKLQASISLENALTPFGIPTPEIPIMLLLATPGSQSDSLPSTRLSFSKLEEFQARDERIFSGRASQMQEARVICSLMARRLAP